MALSSVAHTKPILPRTSDGSDLGSNRANVYSGKALDFDGVNDNVGIHDATEIWTEDFSVSWYGNLDVVGNNFAFSSGIYHGSVQAGINFWYGGSSNTNFTAHFPESDGTGQQGYNLTLGKSYEYWHRIDLVFVSSSRLLSLYQNGILVDTVTVASNVDTAYMPNGWEFGRSYGGSYPLNGKLTNLKVFNVALTAAQVKELYEKPEQAVPTGVAQTSLTLHLPMTEGAGSYVYNANQGALGPELISNGGFDETCQKWGTTDSSTVEISNGKAIWTNPPSAGSFVEQPLDLEVGKYYRVSFDYNATVFGLINLGNTQEAVLAGSGRWTVDMYYGGGDSSLNFQYGWATNSSASIDNVSVKEVVPTHITGTISGATWVSGLPEPLPQTALMDWNRYERQATEDNSDYYQGTLSIPSNSGTIVFKHVTDPLLSDNKYIFGLGTSSLGLTRAIRLRSTGKYGFVSYGSSTHDFDTSVNYTAGKPTTFALSWDETKYVNIYSDGLFAESVYKSGLVNLSGSRTLRLYGSNFNADSNRGTIIYWAYYDRVLTATEINDINTGKVEPTDVDDLEYYFSHQNGYSYNGVTLAKTGGDFDKLLIPSGSTSGKDVFGNTISNPRSSGAYNFDGASWAQIQENSSLNIPATSNVTMEAWVYRMDTPPDSYPKWIDCGSGTSTETNFSFGTLLQSDEVYVEWRTSSSGWIFTDTDCTFSKNEWNHFVVTIEMNGSNSSIKTYKNGSLFSTKSQTTTRGTGGNAHIGKPRWSASRTFVDQVATPRIYNYALTAEQVADNYNEKASTFGGTKVASELDAYIERTNTAGATVEAHSCLLNYLTELDKK